MAAGSETIFDSSRAFGIVTRLSVWITHPRGKPSDLESETSLGIARITVETSATVIDNRIA